MITFFLTPDSRSYFGFQWAGWFCTNNSIPFGWKSSAYVYHSIGLLASHYFRSLLIPCSLYIDDRHTGEMTLQQMPIFFLTVTRLSPGLALPFFLFAILFLLWAIFGVSRNPLLSPDRLFPTLVFMLILFNRPSFLLPIKGQVSFFGAPYPSFWLD